MKYPKFYPLCKKTSEILSVKDQNLLAALAFSISVFSASDAIATNVQAVELTNNPSINSASIIISPINNTKVLAGARTRGKSGRDSGVK